MQDGKRYGYDQEAFAIYDTMMYVQNPVYTLAIGNAWGEAAMLLAAGEKVTRALGGITMWTHLPGHGQALRGSMRHVHSWHRPTILVRICPRRPSRDALGSASSGPSWPHSQH